MADEIASQLVGSKTIADLFGVTVRRVQQLAEEGIIVATKEGRVNKYHLVDTIKRYIDHLSTKANGREQDKEALDLEAQKLEAEVKIKNSKAKIIEMELDELNGEMHRSADVQAMTTQLVFAVRSALLALPGRLAIDLARSNDAAEISDMIRAEVTQTLGELANFEYDPAKYQQLVRDRAGWRALDDD